VRRLTVISGPDGGSSVEIERELVIGREGADLTIADPELSRRHALVRPVDGGVVVEDLGSTNGTFVDGERVTIATMTADGLIRLGATELRLELDLRTTMPAPVEPERPVEPPSRAPRRGTVRRLT
jgi:pSer/pThr/pTyr-binding forkhead associated (FHA) protein